MPKVCILTSVHSALDVRIFHKQAKTLAKGGYVVTLIAPHINDEVIDGIQIIGLPICKNRFLRIFGTLKILVIACHQKADIYHLHDPELLPIGILLKLATGGKIIYDVHEDYVTDILLKTWIPPALRKPIAYIFDLFEKSICQLLDYIIAATDTIASNFDKGKTAIVHNYPVLDNFKYKTTYNFNNPKLFYAGSLDRARGIKQVVKALEYIRSFPNIRLILYGKFEDAAYENEIRETKGFEKVVYRGWIKPELIWHEMCDSTIGILCYCPVQTALVSMPNKLFENMAAGLPLVASNFPLWRDIVTGNNCGINVNPLDPPDIARAIEYLLANPDLMGKMGKNGREIANQKYNWANEAAVLLRIYKELINKGIDQCAESPA
jgi:glycosyltransferase involved in cell wall biosynthesis